MPWHMVSYTLVCVFHKLGPLLWIKCITFTMATEYWSSLGYLEWVLKTFWILPRTSNAFILLIMSWSFYFHYSGAGWKALFTRIVASNEEIERFLNIATILMSMVFSRFNRLLCGWKSISDATKWTTCVKRCRVRWIYFPRKIILRRPQNVLFLQCNLSQKKISGRKGKDSGEIVLYPVNIDEHCSWNLTRHANFPDVCKFCSRRRQTRLQAVPFLSLPQRFDGALFVSAERGECRRNSW